MKTEDTINQTTPSPNENDMKKIMADLDREQSFREHNCWRKYITLIVSVALCIFQLYATLSGTIKVTRE